MLRLLIKWSGSTAVSILTGLFILAHTNAVKAAGLGTGLGVTPDYLDGQQLGKDWVKAYGSKDGLNERAAKPLTSDAQMPTIDGGTQFDAKISCTSTVKFIEMFVGPTATGDINPLIVSQDTDFNGTLDYAYSVPYQVSGVCANGVISCSPGTWTGCQYYKWQADTAGKIGLQTAGPTDLGGCYCVNDSCGSNLVWSNLPYVLKDLGGGALAAVQTVNHNIIISKVDTSGPIMTFYGGLTSGTCGNSSGPAADVTPYFSNPGSLSSDGANNYMAELGDPNSTTSLLHDAHAAYTGGSSTNSCSINRNITVTSSPACSSYASYDVSSMKCIFPRTYNPVSTVKNMNCDSTGFTYQQCLVDMEAFQVDTITLVSQYSSASCWAWSWTPPYGTIPKFGSVQPNSMYVEGGCRANFDVAYQRCYNNAHYNQASDICLEDPVIVDTVTSSVTDGCQIMGNDPNCSLRDEVVDGVATITHSNPTGLSPMPSCRNFTGLAGTHTECYNWWDKERTYICYGGSSEDYSLLIKKEEVVVTSVQDNYSSFTFNDLESVDSSGNVTTSTHTADIPVREDFEGCEQACKTRVPTTNTESTLPGNNAQFQNSTLSYTFYYRSCLNGSCPVQLPGEQIVADCQCLDDFAEAASIMMSLDQASKDIICSSGIPH